MARSHLPGRMRDLGRRTSDPLLVLLLLLFVAAGCTNQTEESEDSPERPEEVAEAPAVDSIEVLDDERSLERRIEDTAIATQVRIALVDARDLRRFDFDPLVVNGRVLLRGEVNTQTERNRAEAVAREVGGVREVTNEITALEQPTLASERPDADTSDGPQVAAGEPVDAAADGEGTTADAQSTASEDAADGQEASEPEQQQEEATYHTVSSGESLWTISRRHGVTIDQIRQLNNLQSNSLMPGQRLRVK